MTTYDPDRVLTPLVRVGARGEGKFRKASWDEALDIVAENMLKIKKTYGPEAMVFSSTHNLSQTQFENLLTVRLSQLRTQRSLCFNAMVTAFSRPTAWKSPARLLKVQHILRPPQPGRGNLEFRNRRADRGDRSRREAGVP
jgi:anaerobic selenocysteine-containing dehydrogenase